MFENTTKVHDWRNYVQYDLKWNWSKLTTREKKIIYMMAHDISDKEVWS